MNLYAIEKQKLLSEPFSEEALKLAHAIYNTYMLNDKELYMEIQLKTIAKLLKLDINHNHTLKKIQDILEDLNEPLFIKEFEFRTKTYHNRFITFFKYKLTQDILYLQLNEEFLHVEKEYMLDSFLSNT